LGKDGGDIEREEEPAFVKTTAGEGGVAKDGGLQGLGTPGV